MYHYSFTLPTGNNKLLAAPLHQQRWRYKVWNHILRCCQSHVYTTVVSLRFVHFSTEIGPLRNWIQRQKQQLHLSNLWEMCTKQCLVTVHKQNTWAGGEPIKNSVLHSSTNDLYRIGPLPTPAAGPFSLLNGFFRDGFDDELASIAHISSTKLLSVCWTILSNVCIFSWTIFQVCFRPIQPSLSNKTLKNHLLIVGYRAIWKCTHFIMK